MVSRLMVCKCTYSGDANYGSGISNLSGIEFSQAAAPVFSLLVGNYPAAQPVQITDGSPDAVIYYTTDGSDPTSRSAVYTGPVTVTSSASKLKAIAGGPFYFNSLISEAVYTITDAPQFSSVHSTGASTETVTLVDAISGAAIYYTLDGTTPSVQSTKYLSPITLTKATTIKAFAAIKGRINSALVTQTFNVAKPATPAVAWAAPKAIQYGTALSSTQLNASSDVTGSFSYSPRVGTVLGAGMHAITVTFTPADRAHFATASKTVELEVLKRALIVSARLTKIYGAPIPKLSYQLTGFVNGDTAAKDVSGKVVLTTKATQKSIVGNYAITVVTNTLKAANYAFDFAQNEITVTKAPLKVTATSFTMPQGGPLPTLTYKLSGLVNDDTARVVTGTPTLTTSATVTSNPGKYAITIKVGSLKAANYSFDFISGTLTVQ